MINIENKQINKGLCPICGAITETPIKLSNHIKKTNDDKHILLFYIRETEKVKSSELINRFCKYENIFSLLDNGETLDNCKKLIYLSYENEIAKKIIEKENLKKIKKQEQKKKIEELGGDDTPSSLLKFFYNLIDGRCFSFQIEIKMTKDLLLKGLTPEEIKKIFKYMANMGHTNIRNVNYIINDALKFYECAKMVNQENTIPYLINHFYTSYNLKLNKKTFLKEIKMLESSQSMNNLSYKQVESVINYMISKKCKILYYFDSMLRDYGNDNNCEDPCKIYSEDREINEVVDEIVNGKMKLKDATKRLYKGCYNKLVNIYMSGEFDIRYNYFEWAYKMQLNLSYKMYKYGLDNSLNRRSRFNEMLIKYNNDEDVKNKVLSLISEFNKWLQKQEHEVTLAVAEEV